jgi:hypothetical protein
MYAQGWQPNIQEKAAEWKKGWDNFNDEGMSTLTNFSNCCPQIFNLWSLRMNRFVGIISIHDQRTQVLNTGSRTPIIMIFKKF